MKTNQSLTTTNFIGYAQEEYENLKPLIEIAKAFVRSSNQYIYIIDFLKKDFLYVSDKIVRLCGEEIDGKKRFGYKMRTEGTKTDISKGINKLLDSVQGKPEENLVETLAIRSMQKAHYTTDNIGHYGLAMDYYTHFTSPIRRYPDMMVHRLLERYLAGGRSVIKNKYEEYCKHCSEMEMVASNAERSSIKY